jgi:hypothetical protein
MYPPSAWAHCQRLDDGRHRRRSVGAVTMFLNAERFIHQDVAIDLGLSSIVVVDELLRAYAPI